MHNRSTIHSEITRIQRDQLNNYLGSYMLRFKICHMIIYRCSGAVGLYEHLVQIEKNNEVPLYLKIKP
jgi:hypothetical protein